LTASLLISLVRTQSHTAGRTSLDQRSVRRTGRHLYSTQQTRQTNFHALNGTRTRTPSKRSAANLRFRKRGQRHRPNVYISAAVNCFLLTKNRLSSPPSFLLPRGVFTLARQTTPINMQHNPPSVLVDAYRLPLSPPIFFDCTL